MVDEVVAWDLGLGSGERCELRMRGNGMRGLGLRLELSQQKMKMKDTGRDVYGPRFHTDQPRSGLTYGLFVPAEPLKK
jgi:hypothetical protein